LIHHPDFEPVEQQWEAILADKDGISVLNAMSSNELSSFFNHHFGSSSIAVYPTQEHSQTKRKLLPKRAMLEWLLHLYHFNGEVSQTSQLERLQEGRSQRAALPQVCR